MEGNPFFVFIQQNLWLVEVVVGIVLLIGAHFLIKYAVKWTKEKTKYKWKEKLEYFVVKPAHFLVWAVAIIYIVNVLLLKFGLEKFLSYSIPIRNGVIVFCVAWFLLRWKNAAQDLLLTSKKRKFLDPATLHLVSRLFSIVVVFLAFLIILQIFHVNIMPLIAFGGVGAAAIGFAAKDVIANFFGGLMIHVTRPFTKGDYIEIPKESVLGTVENIGWYLTCIRDLEHCPIYIPNALFSTAQMKNKTRRTHKKIEETISVRYDDFQQLQNIISDIKTLLQKEEKIDKTIDPIVCFVEFNAYSLDIMVRAYTFVVSYAEFLYLKESILMKIKQVLQSYQADIPFPTTTVQMKKDL